jgi:hypothetical protein
MTDRKYFTIEQANRTLPLVRRVVADLVHEYTRWKEQVRTYEVLSAAGAGAETAEQRAVRDEVEALAQRISGYVEELTSVGCVLKGFDDGLVDFYGKRNGKDVFWCWRLGEESVSHWHKLDAGYAGRRPVETAVTDDA